MSILLLFGINVCMESNKINYYSGSLEDNNHFLLICPKFNNLRFILLDSIQTLIPNNNNIDINIDLLLQKIFKLGDSVIVRGKVFQNYNEHWCPKFYRSVSIYF
jgi:hypothetical protein